MVYFFHRDISSRLKNGSNHFWLITRLRYTVISSLGQQRVFFFFSRTGLWIQHASFEHKNRSAYNGTHLVLIKIPTDCSKTWLQITTQMLSIRNGYYFSYHIQRICVRKSIVSKKFFFDGIKFSKICDLNCLNVSWNIKLTTSELHRCTPLVKHS